MDPNVSLRDYQIADLAYYIANPKCMNLSDPGTGKTPSVVVMQWHLWANEKAGTVWSQPKSLLKKNKDEIHRFTHFEDDEVVIVDGTPKKVRKLLASPRAKVFLMGFDRFALSWRELPDFVKAHHIDEFHMGFGGDGSRRTQELYLSDRKMKWFLPMTGTLVNGKLSSAYPAIKIIEPRYYGSYHGFMNYHGVYDIDNKLVGWKNHGKLAAIFSRHAIRRTFDQVYGPEAKVVLTEVVDMHPRQRELYDEFKEKAVLELEKFYVDGTQPGVAFIRARQITEHPQCFPDLTDPGKFVDIIDGMPGKEERLEIHITDHVRTGKPLVIFAAMVPQQEAIGRLAAKLGMRVAVINGKTSAKERAAIDEAFRSGELNCLVCSPRVAAVGFNWQFCGGVEVPHVIFASLDFLDTTFLQAYRRMMRDKRQSPLLITILEYAASLDQRLFEIIKVKSEDAHKVDPTRPELNLSKYYEELDDELV
ncbi:SNF2-related protein [Faunimonas sp. B44]|uniref:SNF2-related protein n=1 Tax=Faunimonas sp. B44 TaxID=3461493 RepID=UPI004044556D